jgi:hypothetical protein
LRACDEHQSPGHDLAGSADLVRNKLLEGNVLFDVEPLSDITKRARVNGASYNGTVKVRKDARYSYNCAVNLLRQQKYSEAELLDATNRDVAPAVIGRNVLDRLNAVLNPEDRVNGKVSFNSPEMKIPVEGIGVRNGMEGTPNTATNVRTSTGREDFEGHFSPSDDLRIQRKVDGSGDELPDIYAVLASDSNSISLSDFYTAQRMDELTRVMRKMVDDNPQHGEDIVARFAHGLSVDLGAQPFVLYRTERILNNHVRAAMDGDNLDQLQTSSSLAIDFTIPVPKDEFGGSVVTMVAIKPDETLEKQPHPVWSRPMTSRNFVVDEMSVKPVEVTMRELDADCPQGNENDVACWVGNNGLLRNYETYGFDHQVNLSSVASKTSLWQLKVPMSVSPETVSYPAEINHYPWQDQEAEICTITAVTRARINTPVVFGPTAVEELPQLDQDNIFGDQNETLSMVL